MKGVSRPSFVTLIEAPAISSWGRRTIAVVLALSLGALDSPTLVAQTHPQDAANPTHLSLPQAGGTPLESDLRSDLAFSADLKRLTSTTLVQQRSISGVMRPASTAGVYTLATRAALQGPTSSITTPATNQTGQTQTPSKAKKSGKLKWVLIAGAAAGVVLAILLARDTTPTPEITVGTITTGQP